MHLSDPKTVLVEKSRSHKTEYHTSTLSIGLLPSVFIRVTSLIIVFTLHQPSISSTCRRNSSKRPSAVIIAKTLSACIKQLLQPAGPRLASDIASLPPLLLCTRTCIGYDSQKSLTFGVGGPALFEGDLNSQVCVVANLLLSPIQKASNSVRFDYLGSFLFTFNSVTVQTMYEYGYFKYKYVLHNHVQVLPYDCIRTGSLEVGSAIAPDPFGVRACVPWYKYLYNLFLTCFNSGILTSSKPFRSTPTVPRFPNSQFNNNPIYRR